MADDDGIENYPCIKLAWRNMHIRCYKNSNRKHRYLDRGIKVCDSWHSFDNFYNDMKTTFSKGLSLERIDNNGNYCLGNCCWATTKEQANNRVTNHVVEYDGLSKTMAQWAELARCRPSTFRQRYYVYGWNLEQCLTTPTRKRQKIG